MLLGLWLMLGGLQLESVRILHERLVLPVLMYYSETKDVESDGEV